MSPTEAAQLLDLPLDATPEQLEARFQELRTKLEDKIAKAPTPGLKEKYRATLTEITSAFEALTLAADSSSLPMLRREVKPEAGSKEPEVSDFSAIGSPRDMPSGASREGRGGGPAAVSPGSKLPAPRPARKSGGKEFFLVAVIATLVLVAGGWWVMKTRAENAEKTRIAAAAKAAAEREAAARRKLEEETRIATVAAEKAEKERQDKLTTGLRTKMAELRLDWEVIEKEPRTAERVLNEYKGELRSENPAGSGRWNRLTALVGAQQRYVQWLDTYLERHPAKLARARAEELRGARQLDDAAAAIADWQAALATITTEIPAMRTMFHTIGGKVSIKSTPAGLPWALTDAFGEVKKGVTPATADNIAPGTAGVTVSRDGFQPVVQNVAVTTGATTSVTATLLSQHLTFTAEPDVEIWANGQFLGRTKVAFNDRPPGTYKIELRRQGYPPYRTTTKVKQEYTARTVNYNFTALAREDITCNPCSGRGHFTDTTRCTSCSGRGTVRCDNCNGYGVTYITVGTQRSPMPCLTCPAANRGRLTCSDCNGQGRFTHQRSCPTCSGDGRVSQLQLAQN